MAALTRERRRQWARQHLRRLLRDRRRPELVWAQWRKAYGQRGAA